MSKESAIARKIPSAPARWLHSNGYIRGRVLDFGCGRGMDASFFNWNSYDKHWKPDLPPGKFDTILCTYVLNVVGSIEHGEIITKMRSLLNPGGHIYITVRRDIKGFKRGRNCIQRNIELNFKSIRKTSSYEIYLI